MIPDLGPIGGSAGVSFVDDGTNGDVTAGDRVFSRQATVAGVGTRTKVITSRWPDPSTSAVDLGFPRTR